MRHPEFLLIPVLMLSDYALTIAGARMRLLNYGRHFKTEHYELNPIWQQAVAKLRWFNPRHLLITAAITLILGFCIEVLQPSDEAFVEVIEGFLLGLLGAVNGRHLGNLLTFAYLGRHPDAIDGTVTMNHEFALWLSTFQGLGFAVPASLLALFSPRPIVLGFLGGALALLAVHVAWTLRERYKRRGTTAPALAGAGEAVPGTSTESGTNRP